MKRTVVIIHPGALGDVILAVPAICRLRERFPHHRLVLCARPDVSAFFVFCGIVDEWTSWQGPDALDLLVETGRLTDKWQAWLSDCDLAIAWMQDRDGDVAARLASCGAREVIVRSPFSQSLKAVHQSDRFLETIGAYHIESAKEHSLPVRSALSRMGKELLERYGVLDSSSLVVIHPGGGSRTKCVEPKLLAAIVEGVKDVGAKPLIVEGPADQMQVEELLRESPDPLPVVRGVDLITVAGLITKSALYIGHDSGLTHLAALVGTQTIALFGPTDPARWAPRGDHVTVVNGGARFDLVGSVVLAACQVHLELKVPS